MATPKKKTVTPYANVSKVSFDFWGAPVIRDGNGRLSCPGYTGNTYSSNAYDFVTFGVQSTTSPNTPGIAEVDINRTCEVDKNKAAGSSGARLIVHGYNPAEGVIRVKVWTPEQLKAMRELWKDLFPPAAKGIPKPVNVRHPNFKDRGVKTIQITGAEGWTPSNPIGARVLSIRWIEFLQPSRRSVTTTDEAPRPTKLDPQKAPPPGTNAANTNP